MSTPSILFSWGFSLRPSKFLVPLMSNSLFNETEAVSGAMNTNSILNFENSQPNRAENVGGSNRNAEGSESYQTPERYPADHCLAKPIATKPQGVEKLPKKSQLTATGSHCRIDQSVKDIVSLENRTDEEIIQMVESKQLASHKLEKELHDTSRAVDIRRKIISRDEGNEFIANLPFQHFDFNPIQGACCENVIGYMPVPVGIAGPILLNGEKIRIPMATTEGCLVASTHRGCKAILLSGGCNSEIIGNGMTRGPVVRMPSLRRAAAVSSFLKHPENFAHIKAEFESTTRFGKLLSIQSTIAGRNIYIRFKAFTGDAMGMNMISKGTEKSLTWLQSKFPDMQILALSGNYCTDKKAAAINWVNGRGKHVICETVIRSEIVKKVLKTDVQTLVDVNIQKNLVGSAMAGAIGGFNAHAANIVAAIFIATGQDPAQVVEASSCMTLMEVIPRTHEVDENVPVEYDLLLSVSMPCIEVGTIGGGTILSAQSSCLEMLKCRGPAKPTAPGASSIRLAKIIAGAVLAGELSLLSALASGHLIKSHMKHNRSSSSVMLSRSNSALMHSGSRGSLSRSNSRAPSPSGSPLLSSTKRYSNS